MNCQSCGGPLKYADGLYICESCGTKQQVTAFLEKIEVFICYIESDGQGRRTKDSVVAQDLYDKLEAAKINTFYQRVSVAELTGTDFGKACEEALDNAKVLVIAGTSKENFEALLAHYRESFDGKKIFPVYSGINAYDLPKEFGSLQALNYENIGSVNDLTKAVLNTLGRENEIDAIAEAEFKKQKKKKEILLSAGIAVVLILIIGAYILFGTPYVLESKKYAYAEQLTEKGKYIEAIEIYTKLGDYQNSANALKRIYDKYNGYFNSADKKLSLHINISYNSKADIELTQICDGNKIVKTNASAEISNNEIVFQFVDTQSNHGTGNIKFTNSGINLIVKMDIEPSGLSMENYDVDFDFSDKSDAPLVEKINKNIIEEWLMSFMTRKDILQRGYDMTNTTNGMMETGQNIYSLNDTDITIAVIDYEEYEYTFDLIFDEKLNNYISFDEKLNNYTSGDEIVMGVSAPAGIIAEHKIGGSMVPYIENDIMYVPYAEFSWTKHPYGLHLYVPEEKKGSVITEDTRIIAISKKVLSSRNWDDQIKFHF